MHIKFIYIFLEYSEYFMFIYNVKIFRNSILLTDGKILYFPSNIYTFSLYMHVVATIVTIAKIKN